MFERTIAYAKHHPYIVGGGALVGIIVLYYLTHLGSGSGAASGAAIDAQVRLAEIGAASQLGAAQTAANAIIQQSHDQLSAVEATSTAAVAVAQIAGDTATHVSDNDLLGLKDTNLTSYNIVLDDNKTSIQLSDRQVEIAKAQADAQKYAADIQKQIAEETLAQQEHAREDNEMHEVHIAHIMNGDYHA